LATKKPTRSAPQQGGGKPPVIRAEEDDLDMGDLLIGVCGLVGLPVVTLIVLSFIGMPFGGSEEMNSEQADVYRSIDKFVPQMTTQEAGIILNRVQYWVDDRAKNYYDRSRAVSDNSIKNYWQELAQGVLGKAESSLKRVQDEFRNNPEKGSEILDAAQLWFKKVDALQVAIEQEDPFRQVR
jgi:hypothetical protein